MEQKNKAIRVTSKVDTRKYHTTKVMVNVGGFVVPDLDTSIVTMVIRF